MAPDAFTVSVSDVPNDCLRDLAAATARLLRHSTHEVVEFPLEPAVLFCELHRESDSVRVVLRACPINRKRTVSGEMAGFRGVRREHTRSGL
jgi:hypothetical protein